MTPAEVASALEMVVDPELGISIVDLGLIYGIEPGPGRVVILMTTTSFGCPMSAMLLEAAQEAVALRDSATAVEVRYVNTPGWEPGMLSATGRRTLGLGVT